MIRTLSASLAAVALLPACVAVSRDDTDRDAFFTGARVRKELEGEPDHEGTHVELGWRQVDGNTDGLDYQIGAGEIGFGMDGQVGEEAWVGLVGGLSWLHTMLDAETEDLDGEYSYGPYIAVQGGWMATTWLEAFARGDAAVYFPDFSTALGFEVGARFHVIAHTIVFMGWRYARYDLLDLDSSTSFDKLELDASGLVLGLELAF
jgi:hypothetical protein